MSRKKGVQGTFFDLPLPRSMMCVLITKCYTTSRRRIIQTFIPSSNWSNEEEPPAASPLANKNSVGGC